MRAAAREDTVMDEWVHRFGRTERFTHWWTVGTLAVALVSGLTMEDRSGPLFTVHAGAVVALVAGLIGALVLGDRRAIASATKALLVFDRRDRAWLAAVARRPWRRPAEPPWGMFNAGQKVLAWALGGAVAGVIATGLLAWKAGLDGGVHGAFVVVAGGLLAAHVFMAVVNRATRHALNGMVFGRVRRTWAMAHHGEWAGHARMARR